MAGTAVVYVHGLWLNGRESWLLRRSFAAWYDCPVHVLGYASLREDVDVVTRRLADLVGALNAPRIHLLGHSLGGLVILRCLQRYRLEAPGRVVFLGTPATGSQVVRRLGGGRLGRHLIGPILSRELRDAGERRWDMGRSLGVIAGTRSFGVGQLVVKFREPNDGTVAVSETRIRGAAEHLALPVTHTGLVWSARVAREAWSFFEHGHFGN